MKKRCIELIYTWSKGLPHETKIDDAYKMLKQQGVVKEDPVYMEKVNTSNRNSETFLNQTLNKMEACIN